MSSDIRNALDDALEHFAEEPSPAELLGEATNVLPDDVDMQEAKAVAQELVGGDGDDDSGNITDYSVESDVFPAELLLRDRWFVWKSDDGRKIPRAPWSDDHTAETFASWKNEEIWTDFETADEWVGKLNGYGHASCIPAYEDNTIKRLIFFDFDDCRDPDSGTIHPAAWDIIERYDLGAWLSTSGTGIHGFGWGSLPDGFKPSFERSLPSWDYHDEPHLEVYAASRFCALTGEHIEGTPISVPDLGEDGHDLFHEHGSQRVTGTEREPDIDREDLADLDTTTDVSDIYDAIAHTLPSDIRVRSTVTNERADGTKSMDPCWETSKSGTRLAEFDDHWLYRKGNHRLDALQLVALEERIISSPDDYPSGEAFVDAVDALRDRGADIPELKTQSAAPIPPSSADDERPETAETDGGTAADEGEAADARPEDAAGDADAGDADAGDADAGDADDDGAGDDTDGEDADQRDGWRNIRFMLRDADDADERAVGRFEAAMKLDRERDWANLEENDTLYVYDPALGIYTASGRQTLRTELTNGLEEQYRGQTMSEVADHIRGRNTITQQEMGGPPGLIAARNCVIDLHEMDRKDHDAAYRFQSRLGTEFDTDADCPHWRAFLDDAVPNDVQRKKLQEFVGYCLHHWDLPYHKALFLVGPTASGKSTFLDTVNAMLGEDTVTSLTPQQLTTQRFAPAELFGKWANIRNDIPKSTVENTGMFKELIAGDPMKAEKKNKDPFFFEPTAKHLFSANQLPEMEVDDEAFFRRILLIPFPQTVPAPERDQHLDEKLQGELSGILNWALEGLQRLLGQGGFTGDRTPGRTRETWSKWGDSVSRFENLAVQEGDKSIPKADLYAAYVQYCKAESMPSDTQHQFTRMMKAEGHRDGREYVDGKQQRVFYNLSWTGRGEELLEQANDDDDPEGQATGLSGFDN